MNHPLTRSLLFIAGLIAIIVSVFILHNWIVFGQDAYLTQHSLFRNQSQSINTVILGDSRLAGLKNSLIGKHRFNFSYPGENLDQHLLKLYYAHQQHEVDNAVLQVDFKRFSAHSEWRTKIGRVTKVYSPALIKRVYRVSNSKLTREWLHSQSKKGYELLRYSFNDLKEWITGTQGSKSGWHVRDNGDFKFLGGSQKWTDRPGEKQESLARRSASRKLSGNLIHQRMKRQWLRLISFCENHDISLYLIHPPLTEEYQHFLNQYDTDRVKELWDHPAVTNELNYTEIFDENQNYFRNADHLNTRGNRRLSRQFDQDFSQLKDMSR